MRGDQEQDIWVMMTDQDVIILSHGAVIYNLAMWTLSQCHTSHPGTWERMSALSVTSSLFGEMMSQIKVDSLQVHVGFVMFIASENCRTLNIYRLLFKCRYPIIWSLLPQAS